MASMEKFVKLARDATPPVQANTYAITVTLQNEDKMADFQARNGEERLWIYGWTL